MTYFREALLAPGLHFKQLRTIEPIFCDDRPIIRNSTNAIEAEVMWQGQRYLLFMPLRKESLIHIEQLELAMREQRRGPLMSNHIYYEEMLMVDLFGRHKYFDIILQMVPQGVSLERAVHRYKAEDLRLAIHKMRDELNAIGFRHNNLRPINVVICTNGVACPLYYWYAEIVDPAENNISLLEAHIDEHFSPETDATKDSLFVQKKKEEESEDKAEVTTANGITRLRRGNRYGFRFSDGVQIAPCTYTWASTFSEGRAVVAKNGKMGAINTQGKKVIPVIYKELSFDVKSGTFTATRDKYHYLIDYDGKIIRRTLIDKE